MLPCLDPSVSTSLSPQGSAGCAVVFLKKTYFYLCICRVLCVWVHMSAGIHGGQKKVSDPLELELPEVVSHPVWALRVELLCKSSGCSNR